MAFFGVFGESKAVRRIFDTRASYLYAPVLHFSLDGRMALCYGAEENSFSARLYPHLFAAASAHSSVQLSIETLVALYQRHGKKLRTHLPFSAAFAVYDSRCGRLTLGGMGEEKCFLESVENSLFFSSESYLLRSPITVDLLCINA